MRNILINGVSLNDPNGRWHIGRATGFRSPASRTHTALVQPGRDGEFPLPRENFGVAKFGIEMIIYDTNELGVENQGPAQTQINSIALQAAFAGEFEMIEVLRANSPLTPNRSQRAYGIVAEGFSFQIAPNIKTARVTVPVTISDGSWEQLDTSFQTGIAASTTRQVVTLDPLTGTDAPTTNAVIRIGTKAAGTVNIMGLDYDPRTRAMVERTGISYTGTIASGRNVYIDVDKFTAWESSTSGNWDNTTASTDVSNGLNYPGDGKLVIYPVLNPTGATTEVLLENFHPAPGAENGSGYTGWNGTNNVAVWSTSSAPWSQTKLARRYTWTTVSHPNRSSGDMGVLVDRATTGEVFTVQYELMANRRMSVGWATPFAALGTITRIDSSPMVNTIFEPNIPEHRWVTFTMDATAKANSPRVVNSPNDKVAGDWLEISNVSLYPGPYDPNRRFITRSMFPSSAAEAGLNNQYYTVTGGTTQLVRSVVSLTPTAQIAIQTTAGSADVALRLKGRYR